MSEQAKSSIQVVGAGFVGFIAVVAIGALVASRFAPSKAARSSAAVAAPAAFSPAPVPEIPAAASIHEWPASPQPLLGSVADDVVEATAASPAVAPAALAASAGAATPATASSSDSLDALSRPRHAGNGESVSTARAEVKKFAVAELAPVADPRAPAAKPVPRLKLDNSRTSIASTVHYGVTSRSELMGKAAGPVYNFKGAKGAADDRAAELASDAQGRLDRLEKDIDGNSALSPEQKVQLKKKLDQKK